MIQILLLHQVKYLDWPEIIIIFGQMEFKKKIIPFVLGDIFACNIPWMESWPHSFIIQQGSLMSYTSSMYFNCIPRTNVHAGDTMV